MNQYVDNYLRLYCFKWESTDGTVSTTTELEFKSLSPSKLVVGCREWELELVSMITVTVSLSARFILMLLLTTQGMSLIVEQSFDMQNVYI